MEAPEQVRPGLGREGEMIGSRILTKFSFDQRTVSGLPCTRMPGTSIIPLGSRARHELASVCAAAALLFLLGIFSQPLYAGMPLAQKHENRHVIDMLEDKWSEAIRTSNTKVLDSLLADDYIAILPNGTLESREDTLESLGSGSTHVLSINMLDRKVRFYSNTAVVTSLAYIRVDTPDGPMTSSYRYTRVYIRSAQGKWKIVSFEASQVREPGARHRDNDSH
jgi:ketosteroid isomerase-like protein